MHSLGQKPFLSWTQPKRTNSMSCSIKAVICHLCCLFAIPAMTKKPSIFSLLRNILKENKTKPGANIIISWPKPSLGPVQTWETNSAVSSIWTFFALNYYPKKKKVRTKELGWHHSIWDTTQDKVFHIGHCLANPKLVEQDITNKQHKDSTKREPQHQKIMRKKLYL